MGKVLVAKYKLKRSAFAAVVLLILIFVLGIYTTLFIEIPEGEGWTFMMSNMILLAHATLGSLLIFHSASLVLMANRAKSKTWRVVSLIGLFGVILSISTGASFVNADNDLMSALMALGFAISLLAYAYGIYTSAE